MQRKTILILALALSLVIVSDAEIRERLGQTYWAVGGAIIGCVLLVLTGYVWDRSLVQRLKALHAVAESQRIDAPEEGEASHDEIIGLARNIERMAQTLQKVEASYRGIVEDQVDLICRYRGNGKLTFVNGSYAALFGQKRAEYIGQPFPLFQLGLAAPGRTDTPDEIRSFEAPLVSSSGAHLWLLWTQRAIRGSQSDVVEFQAVGHDNHPAQGGRGCPAARKGGRGGGRPRQERVSCHGHA